MARARVICALLMIGLCGGLFGCGASLGLGSKLDSFAEDADRVCVESFNRGVEGEKAAEELGEERGWTGSRIEAEIRYAWADALVGQYEGIAALDPAPEKAGLIRRWNRTALERARLYRRIGDAWLESNEHQEAGYDIDLRMAKVLADHLAEPIPFRACARPTGGPSEERIPTGQLLGYGAPLVYTAEFPLAWAPALKHVASVFGQGHAVGRILHRVPGSETMLIEFRLDRRFRDAVDGADLRLVHSGKTGLPRLVLVRVE